MRLQITAETWHHHIPRATQKIHLTNIMKTCSSIVEYNSYKMMVSQGKFKGASTSLQHRRIQGRANGCRISSPTISTQANDDRKADVIKSFIPWKLRLVSERQIKKRNKRSDILWHDMIKEYQRGGQLVEKDFSKEIVKLNAAIQCYKMPRKKLDEGIATVNEKKVEEATQGKEDHQVQDRLVDSHYDTRYDP